MTNLGIGKTGKQQTTLATMETEKYKLPTEQNLRRQSAISAIKDGYTTALRNITEARSDILSGT